MRFKTSAKAVLLLILFLAFWGTGLSQKTSVFSEATGSGPNQAAYMFDQWHFSLGQKQYEIAKNGRISLKEENGRTVKSRISLEDGEELERVVYFSRYDADLLLLCETSIGGYGSGFVIRLNPTSLRLRWRAHIPAFNVSNGLLEDAFAYVAGIGFIGKLSLETGKYVWKHANLYRKYKESGAFNIFQTPHLNGKLVVFREAETNNQIEANKTTGKIMKVLVN